MSDIWEMRQKPERKADDDARSPFDVDYARIIHSASFRRLQGKTQILNLGDSDFYRTRLTHSLEVAQIAAWIGAAVSDLFQGSSRLPAPAADKSGADAGVCP